jgi:hypothetical protein
LAGHIDALADRFAAGFSRVHSRIQLRFVGHFNRWLDQKGINVKQIDEALIERFWKYFERRKRVRFYDVGALVRLLHLLREQGITPRSETEAVLTPREALLETYRCYLREERGLAQGTIRIVLPFVDRFLAQRFPQAPFRLYSPECERRHHIRSKTGNRAQFGASQTYGHSAPRVFSVSPPSRADRDRSRRLCPLRPILLVLHSSEIPADRQR